MLGYADHIASRNLGNGNLALGSSRQIKMVGSDPCGKQKAEVRRILYPLSVYICRPKWSSDDYISCWNMLIKPGAGIAQSNQFMPV